MRNKILKYTEEKQQEIINFYFQNKEIKKTAHHFNLCEVTIRKFLQLKNIDIWKSMPTENTQLNVVKDYLSGLSFMQIYKKYGFCFPLVKKILNKYNVEPKPAKIYTINENYFKQIDSHTKAYFLGLIMADGCVRWNRPKTKINTLLISLTEEDGYILQEFIDQTNYTGLLKRYTCKSGIYNKRPAQKLCVQNENFVSELTKFGLHPNKSMNHPFFKNLPEKYLPSAILGYFDGDGSVSFSFKDNNRLTCSLIGSLEFTNTLLVILHKNGIKCSLRHRKTKTGIDMGEIRVKGNNSCLKFYAYIYQSNIPSLKRKKEKFEWVINQQKLGLIKNTSI